MLLGMDAFLESVERKAFHMARLATGHEDDALDIVQDSMMSFVKNYATKPEDEWPPLFFRILQNRIRDWHRRNTVRTRLFGWWRGKTAREEAGEDPVQQLVDAKGKSPAETLEVAGSMDAIQHALSNLPWRQQQTFLLRAWEEMSVAETANIMNCTEGTVKTHYSRAVHALREQLKEFQL